MRQGQREVKDESGGSHFIHSFIHSWMRLFVGAIIIDTRHDHPQEMTPWWMDRRYGGCFD